MNDGIIFNVAAAISSARPLGGHRIASYLRDHNLTVEVVDFCNFWKLEELKELVRSRINKNLSFIGFSVLFNVDESWTPTLELFCRWVKDTFPNIKIILGSGVYPKINSKYIDYYVAGYGENAIKVLLKYIISNGAAPMFDLTAPNGAKVIDANQYYAAFPMNSLMVKYEDRDFIAPHEWLGIEFSRGCKFNCDFCNFPVLGVKGDYTRDANDFRLQVTDAHDRFGVSNYVVADETFNDRTEKITKFANVVENLSFDTFFSGYIRPDLLVSRPADREELLRMNFLGHFYGVESFNHDSAKAVSKGMKPERLLPGIIEARQFFKKNKNFRYRGTISLIIGLPFDTVDTVNFTKQWLIDNWQGESFIAWPLMIYQTTKPSKISLDYTSYGYRKINDDVFENLSSSRLSDFDKNIYKHTLIWENDNMSLLDAIDYTSELISIKDTHAFNITSFDIGRRTIDPSIDLDKKLAIRQSEIYQHLESNRYFLDSYIHKKLSL